MPSAWSTFLRTTTTTVSSSYPNGSYYGQSVTFTATVHASYGGTPTGSVDFYDETTSTDLTPTWVTLVSSGTAAATAAVTITATAALTDLPVGNDSISAYYHPTGQFLASNNYLTQTVSIVPTTTTETSSLSPSCYGQSVTFTATVSSSDPDWTPTGSVEFGAGTGGGAPSPVFATVPHTGFTSVAPNTYTATYTTSTLSVGQYSIKAYYTGVQGAEASSYYTVTQTVSLAPTTTTLISSSPTTAPNTYTSYYGQPVTFTATVGCSDDPDWTPSGSIEFGPPYGSGGAPYPVFATAAPTHQSTDAPNTYSATYTASAFSVGEYSIEAYYTGDQGIATTSSQTITQQVVAVPTTTTLTSSSPGTAPSYTSYYGDTVTFTAVVTSSDTSYSPSSSATVEFYDGSSCIGSATSAPYTLSTSTLAVASHTITAVYQDGPNVTASTAAITQTVSLVPTTTTLTSSSPTTAPNTYSSYYGQSVTFTATVSSSDSAWTHSGIVEFGPPYGIGGAPYPVFATAAPTHQSTDAPNTYSATFTASAFSLGEYSIEAYYTGAQTDASSSYTITQQVLPMPVTTTVSGAGRWLAARLLRTRPTRSGHRSASSPPLLPPLARPPAATSRSTRAIQQTAARRSAPARTIVLCRSSPWRPPSWRPSRASTTRSTPCTATGRPAATSASTFSHRPRQALPRETRRLLPWPRSRSRR